MLRNGMHAGLVLGPRIEVATRAKRGLEPYTVVLNWQA